MNVKSIYLLRNAKLVVDLLSETAEYYFVRIFDVDSKLKEDWKNGDRVSVNKKLVKEIK